MHQKIKNWHLSVLVGIVSIISIALIQQYASAQWNDPIGLPGETNGFRLVVNPMKEDLLLSGYDLIDSNLRIDANGQNAIQVANGSNICFSGTSDCINSWADINNSFWQRNGNNIYYNEGNVGIGTTDPSANLEVFGSQANTPVLKLHNSSGDIELSFQEYASLPPGSLGDITIRYNGNNSANNGFSNWLEFLGRDPSQEGGRPIMTMQRDYITSGFPVGTIPTYHGVGIGVPSGTNITAKLRVQNYGPEDILQLYDDETRVLTVANGGNVGIGMDTPNKQLHVASATSNAEIDIQSGTNAHWGIYQVLGGVYNADLRFWNSDNRVTFTDNGNVGIGTINPIASLHVNNSPGQNYAAYFNGNVALQHTSGGPYNYLQLDRLSAGLLVPPAADCNEDGEKAKMIYDASSNKLYICDESGWVSAAFN